MAAVRDSVRPAIPALVVLAAAAAVTVSLLTGDRSDAVSDSGCRATLGAEHERGATWWRIGQRPTACAELSNAQFAELVGEVTDDSRWDRCRSDLHALFADEHTWAEPGLFPGSCTAYDKTAFDRVSLEAGQWSMQDSYIAHGWPVEVIGTPTSRPSNWRELPQYD